jgi:hypothetical protein
MTFKERFYICACGADVLAWRWNTDPNPVCPDCQMVMDERADVRGQAPGVIVDSIPGGVLIRHGICHPDGSPKRYDSMTEIRREAARRGLTIHGETPNAPSNDGHVEVDR